MWWTTLIVTLSVLAFLALKDYRHTQQLRELDDEWSQWMREHVQGQSTAHCEKQNQGSPNLNGKASSRK